MVDHYLYHTGTWIYSQLCNLQSWQALVLCRDTMNLEDFPWPHICSLDRLFAPRAWLNRAANRGLGCYPDHLLAARRRGVRLLHAHFGPHGVDSLTLARWLGVPLITNFYGFDVSLLPRQPGWQERYDRLFGQGALFLVEGPHMRAQVIGLGCPPGKVRVRRLGIDPQRFRFQERRPQDRGEPVRVLVVGTFTEKKGIPDALRALAAARRQGAALRMTLVGDASGPAGDPAIAAEVERLIAELDLGQVVTRTGAIPHERLIEEYHRHQLMLAPSVQAASGDNEGGAPVTITEAAATGLPVVATRHCDIPEVVRHEESGLLAEERDVETLAGHLLLLAQHPERWPAMGRAARARVEAEFDARRTTAQLEQLYDEVAA